MQGHKLTNNLEDTDMNTQKKQFGVRTVVALVLVAAFLFGGIGITNAAAQRSIPGDALYPVKTTIERTRLSMTQDAGNRAQMKMTYAEKRLEEIGKLITEGRFSEINLAVLSFESEINGAILELESLSKVDPQRAASLSLEITSALARYTQHLVTLVANAPDSVKAEVSRALDSSQTVSSLEMPTFDDNSNLNGNDAIEDNSNDAVEDNGNDAIDDYSNMNGNEAFDDNSNVNSNDNSDDLANSNNDNSNSNLNFNGDDSANSNDNSSNTNTSSNTNADDHGGSGKDSSGKSGSNSNGGGGSDD